jgi:O-antigen/teichoic acid export membrane protein
VQVGRRQTISNTAGTTAPSRTAHPGPDGIHPAEPGPDNIDLEEPVSKNTPPTPGPLRPAAETNLSYTDSALPSGESGSAMAVFAADPVLPASPDGLPGKAFDPDPDADHVAGKSALSRTAFFLILNTGLNGVLGIGFWAVATRIFPKSVVGASGSLISLMIFLAALSQLNLYQALPRFLQVFGAEGRRLVRICYLACIVAATLVATLVVVVCSITHLGGVMGSLSPVLAGIFVIGTAVWTVFTLQDAVLTGLRRAPLVPLENLVFGLVKLALLFLIGTGAGRGGIYYAWLLGIPAIAIPLNLYIFRVLLPHHERQSPHNPLIISTLRRTLGLEYLSALFGQMSSNLVPVLVANILGSVANASFYSAWVIIAALDTVAQNFSISLTVEAGRDPAHMHRYLVHAQQRVAQILLPVIVVLFVGAPLLLSLFGSSYSSSGTGILRVMLVATGVRALNLLAIGMHRSCGEIRSVLQITALTGVSVVVLSLIAMPLFGVIGVAWAYLVGNGLVAILSFTHLRRKNREMAQSTA